MTLLVLIDGLVKNNSQFIIATHSPVLIAYPNADILELSRNEIQKAGYQETEHYKIANQFTDNLYQIIKYLLNN